MIPNLKSKKKINMEGKSIDERKTSKKSWKSSKKRKGKIEWKKRGEEEEEGEKK